jgi:hypothetical protein
VTAPRPGYLWAAPEDDGSDSLELDTHAWLEALLPGTDGRGEPVWVSADPTNRSLAGEAHVKIGHGRFYSDVEEAPEGHVIRYAPESHRIVGLTIISPRHILSRDGHLVVTTPEAVDHRRGSRTCARRRLTE